MRIAVVGAGLAGLGVCYFLKKQGHDITIFDERGIGFGASGIPIGLCHPYVGRNGKPSKFAEEAMQATRELIAVAEKAVGKKLADQTGILRFDWTPVEWYSDLEKMSGGILIKSGMTVQLGEYVKALFASFTDIQLIQKKYAGEEFDRVIFACGRGMSDFGLPLSFVKGQVLIGTTERALERSEMRAKGHLSKISGNKVQLGATYEHHFLSSAPDIEVAKKDLAIKLNAFFPIQDDFIIEDCWAGVRACVKDGYLPIVQKINDKTFVFTGLGSRGLLYHAYYGRHLANMICL
jgi:glycine/D-amino acid oxidase-like deaminating enzyme